jgi:MSHA biogenesis protein MshQ
LPINDGGDPAALRIRNVTNSGFEIAYVEPDSEDGIHPTSTADWFAIPSGDHTLSDGTRMLLGSISTTEFQSKGIGGSGWENINFGAAFSVAPTVYRWR